MYNKIYDYEKRAPCVIKQGQSNALQSQVWIVDSVAITFLHMGGPEKELDPNIFFQQKKHPHGMDGEHLPPKGTLRHTTLRYDLSRALPFRVCVSCPPILNFRTPPGLAGLQRPNVARSRIWES